MTTRANNRPEDAFPPDIGPPAEPTLARRIAFKSLGGMAALPLNVLLQLMVPRALGAGAYGAYTYLSAFFTSVMSFGDSGTSQAFYNKVSQRPGEKPLYAFYARFALALFILVFGGIGIAYLLGAGMILWPNSPKTLVILAAVMVFGNWLISIAGKAIDANALTGKGEAATVAVRLLLVLAVAALFFGHSLILKSFLVLQTVFNSLLIAGLVFILATRGRARGISLSLSPREVRIYSSEFWGYCHPLLAMSFVVLIADIFDRWLLQHFAGSVEQGFLGLGLQIGAVVFIFGGATATLSGREFARAHYDRDEERLRKQFLFFLPRTYSVTAFFGVFFAVESPDLVRIFGGAQFAAAAPATAILCLYPLHQVYGQMGNSLLYATSRTRTIRTIGIIGVVTGSFLTFFLLAPSRLGGLGLGAIGIASKIVIHQLVIVNFVLWTNAKYLRVSFGPLIAQQILAPLVLAGCAFVARAFADTFLSVPFIVFAAAGVVYLFLTLCVTWFSPELLGFRRPDIERVLSRMQYARTASQAAE